MVYLYLASTVLVAVLAYLAGLLTFKRSLRWCPGCGTELACPHRCVGRPHWPRRIGLSGTESGLPDRHWQRIG